MTDLPATPDTLLALLESIQLDKRPCLIDRMYQTAEERAGYAKHMLFMSKGAEYRQRAGGAIAAQISTAVVAGQHGL